MDYELPNEFSVYVDPETLTYVFVRPSESISNEIGERSFVVQTMLHQRAIVDEKRLYDMLRSGELIPKEDAQVEVIEKCLGKPFVILKCLEAPSDSRKPYGKFVVLAHYRGQNNYNEDGGITGIFTFAAYDTDEIFELLCSTGVLDSPFCAPRGRPRGCIVLDTAYSGVRLVRVTEEGTSLQKYPFFHIDYIVAITHFFEYSFDDEQIGEKVIEVLL